MTTWNLLRGVRSKRRANAAAATGTAADNAPIAANAAPSTEKKPSKLAGVFLGTRGRQSAPQKVLHAVAMITCPIIPFVHGLLVCQPCLHRLGQTLNNAVWHVGACALGPQWCCRGHGAVAEKLRSVKWTCCGTACRFTRPYVACTRCMPFCRRMLLQRVLQSTAPVLNQHQPGRAWIRKHNLLRRTQQHPSLRDHVLPSLSLPSQDLHHRRRPSQQ